MARAGLPGFGVAGREHCLRVAHCCPGQLESDGPAERRRLGLGPEALEEEVVGHLDDEVVEALDQLGVRVGVTSNTQRAQHQLAELVGGGDRGAVEAGQRVGDPLVAQVDVGADQMVEQYVARA